MYIESLENILNTECRRDEKYYFSPFLKHANIYIKLRNVQMYFNIYKKIYRFQKNCVALE